MQKSLLIFTFNFVLGQCFSQVNNNTVDSFQLKTASALISKDSLQSVIKADLSIYPNPAKHKVTLQVKGFEPGTAHVKILDAKGKLIRDDNRLLTNGTEDIVMFLMLPPGIYFVIVSEKGKVSRRKLIMQ